MKKLYKKTLKACGGTILYLDKVILKELGIKTGDEVVIELSEGKVTITKPTMDCKNLDDILKRL